MIEISINLLRPAEADVIVARCLACRERPCTVS